MKKWYLVCAIIGSAFVAIGQHNDLNCNPCKLGSLLNEWASKYSIRIIYSPSLIDSLAEPVYVEIHNKRFKKIVKKVFKLQSKLDAYFSEESELVVRKKSISAKEESEQTTCITLQARVLSKTGQLLAAASVELEGKSGLKADKVLAVLLSTGAGVIG